MKKNPRKWLVCSARVRKLVLTRELFERKQVLGTIISTSRSLIYQQRPRKFKVSNKYNKIDRNIEIAMIITSKSYSQLHNGT